MWGDKHIYTRINNILYLMQTIKWKTLNQERTTIIYNDFC